MGLRPHFNTPNQSENDKFKGVLYGYTVFPQSRDWESKGRSDGITTKRTGRVCWRRWTWRLRRRARSRAFWKNYAMKPPCQRDAEGFGLARHCAGFSMPGWQKEKPRMHFCRLSLLWITSGSFRFPSFGPVTVAMFFAKWLFFVWFVPSATFPASQFVKLVGWVSDETMN